MNSEDGQVYKHLIGIVIFNEFKVVFTVSSFVGNPVYVFELILS